MLKKFGKEEFLKIMTRKSMVQEKMNNTSCSKISYNISNLLTKN